MKRKRFSVEQIAYGIAQAESGTTVTEICRRMGVSEPTVYRWKKEVRRDGRCGGASAQAAR
jgi:putative transposase